MSVVNRSLPKFVISYVFLLDGKPLRAQPLLDFTRIGHKFEEKKFNSQTMNFFFQRSQRGLLKFIIYGNSALQEMQGSNRSLANPQPPTQAHEHGKFFWHSIHGLIRAERHGDGTWPHAETEIHRDQIDLVSPINSTTFYCAPVLLL